MSQAQFSRRRKGYLILRRDGHRRALNRSGASQGQSNSVWVCAAGYRPEVFSLMAAKGMMPESNARGEPAPVAVQAHQRDVGSRQSPDGDREGTPWEHGA